MYHHIKSAITICLQIMSNMFTIEYLRDNTGGSAPMYLSTYRPVIRDLCKVD